MESQCLRLKIRPGKTEEFLSWARELKNRGPELREVLGSAGIHCEMLFLDRKTDGDYLVLYTRSRDLAKSNEALMNSQLPLDCEVRRIFQATCEFAVTPLETLLEVNL